MANLMDLKVRTLMRLGEITNGTWSSNEVYFEGTEDEIIVDEIKVALNESQVSVLRDVFTHQWIPFRRLNDRIPLIPNQVIYTLPREYIQMVTCYHKRGNRQPLKLTPAILSMYRQLNTDVRTSGSATNQYLEYYEISGQIGEIIAQGEVTWQNASNQFTAEQIGLALVNRGDLVSNLTDGSQAVITNVENGIITMGQGLHGGRSNRMQLGDEFIIQTREESRFAIEVWPPVNFTDPKIEIIPILPASEIMMPDPQPKPQPDPEPDPPTYIANRIRTYFNPSTLELPAVGQIFSVDIELDNPQQQGFVGYQVGLRFDTDVIEYVDSNIRNIFGDSTFSTVANDAEGDLLPNVPNSNFAIASLDARGPSGVLINPRTATLATIRFRVVSQAPITITMNDIIFSDTQSMALSEISEPGNLSLTSPIPPTAPPSLSPPSNPQQLYRLKFRVKHDAGAERLRINFSKNVFDTILTDHNEQDRLLLYIIERIENTPTDNVDQTPSDAERVEIVEILGFQNAMIGWNDLDITSRRQTSNRGWVQLRRDKVYELYIVSADDPSNLLKLNYESVTGNIKIELLTQADEYLDLTYVKRAAPLIINESICELMDELHELLIEKTCLTLLRKKNEYTITPQMTEHYKTLLASAKMFLVNMNLEPTSYTIDDGLGGPRNATPGYTDIYWQ